MHLEREHWIRRVWVSFALIVVVFVGEACNSSTGASSVEQPVEEGASVGWTGELARFFTSSISDCEDLKDWMSDQGKNLLEVEVQADQTWHLKYAPMAVRYCVSSKDAFGSADEASSVVIERGRRTTQFVLETMVTGTAGSQPDQINLTMDEIMEVVEGDTIPCAFVHMEPLPPSIPFKRYIVAFDHPETGQDRTVLIRRAARPLLIFRFPIGAFRTYEALNIHSTLVQWGV